MSPELSIDRLTIISQGKTKTTNLQGVWNMPPPLQYRDIYTSTFIESAGADQIPWCVSHIEGFSCTPLGVSESVEVQEPV